MAARSACGMLPDTLCLCQGACLEAVSERLGYCQAGGDVQLMESAVRAGMGVVFLRTLKLDAKGVGAVF